jgi:uncharacterized membrane protein (DUF106 family)
MSIVNGVLRVVFDTILGPFRTMHPLVGLVVLSIPVSAAMLWVFKRVSNQKRITEIKRRIHAGLFEIRLFNDDLRAMFQAQGQILAANLAYLGHSLVPFLWMIVPFALLVGQLQFHYGFRAVAPRQPTVVTVQLGEGWEKTGIETENGRPRVELEVPPGLRVETPAIWIPSQNELAWRVKAENAGDYEMTVRAAGESYTKSLRVSEDIVRLAPKRVAAGFVGELLNPAESPLPKSSPLRSIEVAYAPSGPMFFDVSFWIWIFVGLTIVMAFVLRRPMGVTI